MIVIDYQSRKPIYEQLVERFQTLILKGVFPQDAQLPSVRSLAVELSINPNTIQKAYAVLEQQGYIYPVKGKGNFVAECTVLVETKKEAVRSAMKQLVKEGKEIGMSMETCMEIVRSCWDEGGER